MSFETPRTSHLPSWKWCCPSRWTSGRTNPTTGWFAAFRGDVDVYMAREVLPHVPDAWVDYDKTKVGYEIPINQAFLRLQATAPA